MVWPNSSTFEQLSFLGVCILKLLFGFCFVQYTITLCLYYVSDDLLGRASETLYAPKLPETFQCPMPVSAEGKHERQAKTSGLDSFRMDNGPEVGAAHWNWCAAEKGVESQKRDPHTTDHYGLSEVPLIHVLHFAGDAKNSTSY